MSHGVRHALRHTASHAVTNGPPSLPVPSRPTNTSISRLFFISPNVTREAAE